MKEELNNTVIKVLSKEHGKKVIKWWKDQGVDTKAASVDCVGYYYGLFDGEFDFAHKNYIIAHDIKVIELPEEQATEMAQSEKSFPREMWVWDDIIDDIKKETVFAKIEHEYGYIVKEEDEHYVFIGYKNARELDELEELTTEQAEQKLSELVGKIVKIK